MLSQEYGRPDLSYGLFGSPVKTRLAGAALGMDLKEDPKPYLNEFPSPSPSFQLNPRNLMIPGPSSEFKSNPRYNPTILPGVIDREILNPGTFGIAGFGVS